MDGLNETVKTALKDSERCVAWPWPWSFTMSKNSRTMREIEQSLKRGPNTPYAKCNKENVKIRMLQIQQILDTIHGPSLPLSAGERDLGHSASMNPHDTATTPVSESGAA